MNLDSGQILKLVQQALDEIDERPVDVTGRRTARVASLLGDTEMALYLSFELKALVGGHPSAHADDSRRLMADPSLWGSRSGPVQAAWLTYEESRKMLSGENNGKISVQSLAEIETILANLDKLDFPKHGILDVEEGRLHLLKVRERARQRMFSALCSWERQLTYADVNERIFERFRSKVDSMLAQGSPAVLDQFSAVYRRLREAASADQSALVSEEIAHAAVSCRRILKSVADHVLPGVAGGKTADGHSLDDSAYKNRIYEFVKTKVASDTHAEAVLAALGGIYQRFTALDKLASKGVHAQVGLAEAELCAIGTYLAAGELLAISTTPAEIETV